jgi:zinc/manganese transport system permease protein
MFLGLVVMNLVAGFHALGTLMAVGLMMLPAAAARFWSADISRMVVIAAGLGLASAYLGLTLSYHSGAPSGPLVILVAGVFYLLSLALGPAGGLIRLLRPRRHLEA